MSNQDGSIALSQWDELPDNNDLMRVYERARTNAPTPYEAFKSADLVFGLIEYKQKRRCLK